MRFQLRTIRCFAIALIIALTHALQSEPSKFTPPNAPQFRPVAITQIAEQTNQLVAEHQKDPGLSLLQDRIRVRLKWPQTLSPISEINKSGAGAFLQMTTGSQKHLALFTHEFCVADSDVKICFLLQSPFEPYLRTIKPGTAVDLFALFGLVGTAEREATLLVVGLQTEP